MKSMKPANLSFGNKDNLNMKGSFNAQYVARGSNSLRTTVFTDWYNSKMENKLMSGPNDCFLFPKSLRTVNKQYDKDFGYKNEAN